MDAIGTDFSHATTNGNSIPISNGCTNDSDIAKERDDISSGTGTSSGSIKQQLSCKQAEKMAQNGQQTKDDVFVGLQDDKDRDSNETPSCLPLDGDSRVKVLRSTCQLRELHTLLRDRDTSRSDFVFYADRLIRLVVEEALNCLPYAPLSVVTPGGHAYDGLRYIRGNCGVSIMRSGEAMEKGLRDCCRAIRIGKVLIQQDDEKQQPEPIYVKLPPGIQERRVLLMYPVLGDGSVATIALHLLVNEYGIPQDSIILLNIFSTKKGIEAVLAAFPGVTLLTTEVHDLVPYHFCAKYFGTE